MKLSNETLNVLKNFATINEGMQFKQGKKLKTISQTKAVMAEASITDEFPETFCVYDLNQFLSVNSLFKDKPELKFDDSDIIFQSGRNKIKYRKCAEGMILKAPDKDIKLGSVDVSFTLSAEDYHLIMESAKVLSSPHIAIVSDGETTEIITHDYENDSSHKNSLNIDTKVSKGKYSIVFIRDNFKMIPGSYDVDISFNGVAHFKNTKEDVQYWVAFESKLTKIG